MISPDVMLFAIGILCGVGLSIPLSVVILMAITRPAEPQTEIVRVYGGAWEITTPHAQLTDQTK